MLTNEEARGTLYDGTGKKVEGNGPASCIDLMDQVAFKTLITNRQEREIKPDKGDMFYLLSDHVAETKWLPLDIVLRLTKIVKDGGMVGLMGRDQKVFEHVVWLISHPDMAEAAALTPVGRIN